MVDLGGADIDVELELFAIALVLLLLSFLGFQLERSTSSWLSESSVSLVAGLVLGALMLIIMPEHTPKFDDKAFFNALLPPIILQAGFTMKKSNFFKNMTTILLLAVVGTIIATTATAAFLYAVGYMDLNTCLLFGALISAVDPVATLAVFRKVRAPTLLFNLVFGESVLNDAVSIVLFSIFLHLVEHHEDLTWTKALLALLQLIGIFLGSFVLAAIVSLSASFAIKNASPELKQYPLYEVSITLLSVYLGYLLAEITGLSGIVALFFSGTLTAHYTSQNISHIAQISEASCPPCTSWPD